MDEWRQKLLGELVPEAPTMQRSAATELEIAFGYARSELTYVLELGRAHKLPATGAVYGDDVWLTLGSAKLRFVYDRKNGAITASIPGRDEQRITYDAGAHALDGPSAGPFDMRAFVREAIDATVAAYKAAPPPPALGKWDAPAKE